MTACRHVLLVLMVLMSWPQLAWASATAPELVVALELFREGDRHQRAQRWQPAASKYRKAVLIKETPGLRYRIGYCEEQQGRLVEAGLEYQRALELIDSGMRADDVASLLPEQVSQLAERTPRVTVILNGELARAALTIDGDMLSAGVWGQSIPLNPGVHLVRVHAPGYLPQQQNLSLRVGERRRLEMTLAPAPGEVSAEVDTHAHRETGSTARTVVIAGESAVLAAGIAVGVIAVRERHARERQIAQQRRWFEASSTDASCSKPPSEEYRMRCREFERTIRKQHAAVAAARLGFAGAGLSAIAGVLTYSLWPDARVRPGVSLGDELTGVLLGGRF